MKIPLQIVNEQVEVAAILRATKHRIGLANVNFVVDTRSNKSFLGYGEILRLNLPTTGLQFSEHTRIGGCTFKMFKLSGVTLSFEDEKGGIFRVKPNNMHVVVPTKKGEERENATRIPSILGLDFLKETKMALCVNPSRDTAYFDLE